MAEPFHVAVRSPIADTNTQEKVAGTRPKNSPRIMKKIGPARMQPQPSHSLFFGRMFSSSLSGVAIAALLADSALPHKLDFIKSIALPKAADQTLAATRGWGFLHTIKIGSDPLQIVAANTTNGTTLNVNGLGAITIVKCGTVGLAANDLLTTVVADAIYDGTNFELQNPNTPTVCGVPTSAGVLGTNAAGLLGAHGTGQITPIWFNTGAGSANAQTVNLLPVPGSYQAGMLAKAEPGLVQQLLRGASLVQQSVRRRAHRQGLRDIGQRRLPPQGECSFQAAHSRGQVS